MSAQIRKTVAMIAGEPSGDLHGAHVIEALRRRHNGIAVYASGGTAMKGAGANIVVDIKALSVMGITAVLVKMPQIIKLMRRLKRFLADIRPDLLILIDFPDFNLHLAGFAKKLGIPILYYISPTVWAWRTNRIHKIKKRVDHMAVILPFEKPIYDRYDVPVTYVGHPLVDQAAKHAAKNRIHRNMTRPTIALLPGSREDEVKRLLPHMLQAAQMLQARNASLKFVISRAPSIEPSFIANIADGYSLHHIMVTAEPVHTVFEKCTISVVASGTASLEAAIYGIPTLIVYQVSKFTYWLGNKLVDVPHIGLANLITNRRVFPELVQAEVNAENIASIVQGLLTDKHDYQKMLDDIKMVQQLLGQAGASNRVADIACRMMEGDRDF